MKYITTKTWFGESIQCIPETKEEIAEQKEMERERELYWCKGHKEEYDWYRLEDGQHKEVHKHHYRCAKCHKITQIG